MAMTSHYSWQENLTHVLLRPNRCAHHTHTPLLHQPQPRYSTIAVALPSTATKTDCGQPVYVWQNHCFTELQVIQREDLVYQNAHHSHDIGRWTKQTAVISVSKGSH